jgi:sec-independent protein translocase protein TatC
VNDEATMDFLDHLEELRRTILRCLSLLLLSMLVCVPFTRQILSFLFQPLRELGVDPATYLVVPQVMGGFKVAVAVVFWSGLLLSTPFMIYVLAQFVSPGLHEHERRIVRRSSGAAVLLFFAGAALGYYGTTRAALDALLFALPRWMGTSTDWVFLTDYIAFVLKLVLGFGLSFEFPLVLLGLGYAGLVEVSDLTKYRRQVIVILLIIAMMLTPPEPVSQLIMASALYILYEGCILILRRHEKREAAKD